ncbi:hypothetical protein EYF80_056147 [Liparis tanakae]|uniref:Uncharacterized protein n=1 Tax=Liparis tanakae TaxID=230148 RepID=A0A4Z2EXW7_9TELE|nr:hypothetical protein EYF80_056147 [Liparis tanakae]
MSMRPRSKAPPSRNTLPLFFEPLEPCMTMWILDDLHLGTSMGFMLPSRSLTNRLSASSRLSQLLQAK